MKKYSEDEYERSVSNVGGRIRGLESRQRDLLGDLAEVRGSIQQSQIELASFVNDRAPIATIPNEILAMIFRAGKDPSLKGWGASRLQLGPLDKQHNEVIVSHVTKRFRTTALSSPSLWTEIYASPHRALEELQAYLERSRACAVDIRLDLSQCCCPKRHQRKLNTIMKLISAHSHRWRRIIVDGDSAEDANPLMIRLPDVPAPYLEHLSLSNVITNCSANPTLITGGAPLLSFIRMDYMLTFSLPQPLPEPLFALTTLHVDEAFYEDTAMTYEHFRAFLGALSATLVNLSVSGMVFTFDPAMYPPEIVEMPALRSLRMGCPAEVAHVMIMGISAPGVRDWALKDISDNLTNEIELWEKEVWERLIAYPKFPDLDSITIVNCDFSEFTVQNLTRAFSTASQVSLVNMQQHVLDIFFRILDRGDRWPQLCTLAVWDCGELSVQAEAISAMVGKRAREGRPLIRMELDEDDLEEFGQLAGPLRNVELGPPRDYVWPPGLGYLDEDDAFI